ncbi:MAG: SCO family protein [Agarilytica sp.]
MTEELNALEQKRSRGIWITVASIFCVIALFMAMFLHKITSPRVLSKEELLVNRAIVFDPPRIIEPFELLDQYGNGFDLERLKGKWSLIYFGFTHCPDICPTSLSQLNKVLDVLDQDVAEQTQVILVSLDPARDTPEQMRSYLDYFSPSFVGVTGDFLEILSFTRNVNVAFNKVVLDDDYTIDHTGHLVLINPNGHYHGFFKPPFELAKLKVTYSSIVSQF